MYVSGKLNNLNPSPVLAGKKDLSVSSKRETVNLHVNSCQSYSFCQRVSTKERCKSRKLSYRNKPCERCFLCRSLEFCKSCHKCPNCCSRFTYRGQIAPVLRKVGSHRGQPQSGNNTPVRPNLTRSPTIISCYVNPHKNLYLLEALHQLLNKNAVEPVASQKFLGFYNRLFLVPKPNHRCRPILDLNTFLNTVIQHGDTRDSKNLPAGRGVQTHTSTYQYTVQEVHLFSRPGSVLPVQSTTLWPVHSTHGVHSGGQRGQFYCATIACHVGLNSNSGGRRTLANNQEKWTFGFDRVRVLECTIAVSFGNSSSRWPPYWKAFEIPLKIFTVFRRVACNQPAY